MRGQGKASDPAELSCGESMKNGLEPHVGQRWWDNFSLVTGRWTPAKPQAYEVWQVTIPVLSPGEAVVLLKDEATGVMTEMPKSHLWEHYTPVPK